MGELEGVIEALSEKNSSAKIQGNWYTAPASIYKKLEEAGIGARVRFEVDGQVITKVEVLEAGVGKRKKNLRVRALQLTIELMKLGYGALHTASEESAEIDKILKQAELVEKWLRGEVSFLQEVGKNG